jgi:drug/metabolite transporter (DMT)-like permease
VFLRNLFATLMLMPLLAWRGPSLLRSTQLPLYGVRVVVSLLSMQAWFYAISLIPIGEVTAISFLAPVLGTVGAIVLLGERVRLRRWTAIMVGLLGAMIILRPGMAPFGIGQACAIFSALSIGLAVIMIKQLTTVDDPDKIVFLTNLMLTPLSLVPALFVWTWPTLDAVIPVLGPVLGMGLTAALGHVALVRGYAATDASLGMTFEFSRLPFSVAIAYLAFGETIDMWTWVGAAVIFAASVYIVRREALLARLRRAQSGSRPGAA